MRIQICLIAASKKPIFILASMSCGATNPCTEENKITTLDVEDVECKK